MEKPDVRGPSPSRKAHLALGKRMNRKSKPAPPPPAGGDVARKVHPPDEPTPQIV